jgi:hypothetical protein
MTKGNTSTSTPFLSTRLSPSLNFNEFSLLCAHLTSAETCCPVERLKSCFDQTLSTAHTQWAERMVAILAPSIFTCLSVELGNAENSKVDTSVIDVVPQKQISPFRFTWRLDWVELDPDGDSNDFSGNREKMALPTSVCTSLSTFLFSLTHSTACAMLSVDTVQQLPPSDIFPSSSSTILLEDNAYNGEPILEPVNRIAHYVSTALYSTALCTIADTYSSLLKSFSSSSSPGDEDVALQALFDLMACEALGERCGLPVPQTLINCMASWRAKLDPINAEILTPLLRAASVQFAAKTHLLLPELRQPKETAAIPPSPLTASSSNASMIGDLFPSNPARRFALLPLPMSTHFQGSSWVNRDKEREKNFQTVAEKQLEGRDASSVFAAKSLLSGLSISQQQQNHAEQLGKSLISTWGNFLGQSQ